MPDHTNVWTDGSLVLDRVAGVSSSGALFDRCWSAGRCGQVDDIRADDGFSSCGVSFLFLVLSSLFRELKCGVSF